MHRAVQRHTSAAQHTGDLGWEGTFSNMEGHHVKAPTEAKGFAGVQDGLRIDLNEPVMQTGTRLQGDLAPLEAGQYGMEAQASGGEGANDTARILSAMDAATPRDEGESMSLPSAADAENARQRFLMMMESFFACIFLGRRPQSVPKQAVIWLVMAVYLLTGVAQPLAVDFLKYQGAIGARITLLPLFANVLGMAVVGIGRKGQVTWASISSAERKRLAVMMVVDLVSGLLLVLGIEATGGGLFVVIYSSCTAWTAILSYLLLGKRLTKPKIIGIGIVCCGLAMSYLNAASGTADESEERRRASALVVLGATSALVGSILHSLMFVLSDSMLSHGSGIESWQVCSWMGRSEAAVVLVWILMLFSTQSSDELLLNDVREQGGTVLGVIAAYAMLTTINAMHAASFFHMLGAIGAVSSAVMKGMQTVAVWVLSATMYCKYQESQCFTFVKAASVAVVLFGTTLYSLSPSPSQSYHHVPTSSDPSPPKASSSPGAGTDVEVGTRQPSSPGRRTPTAGFPNHAGGLVPRHSPGAANRRVRAAPDPTPSWDRDGMPAFSR